MDVHIDYISSHLMDIHKRPMDIQNIIYTYSRYPMEILCYLDKPAVKRQHTSHQLHQAKETSFHYRQNPQKCDLICPGVPPLSLPPNFIHNCSSPAKNSTQNTGSSTATSKPNTTTESSEEESEESTEENVEITTKKSNGETKKPASRKNRKYNNIHHSNQLKKKQQSKQHQQKHQNKKHVKKEKVLLKHKMKKELLKHNKHFKGRSRLDGCYVICTDDNGSSNPGNQGGYGLEGTDTDGYSSEESEDDSYVAGEDTPIEIIYVPGSTKGNQRPVDVYQTNNYALLEPQPALGYGYGYGYDPFFWEGKQKKIKKRKQNNRKKEGNKR